MRARPPHDNPQGANESCATKSLEDLFVNLLKDVYYAEKQILKALPKMAKKADSDELRQAFEHHLEGNGRPGASGLSRSSRSAS